jgi:uncharacterized paraquat-inducible protein A
VQPLRAVRLIAVVPSAAAAMQAYERAMAQATAAPMPAPETVLGRALETLVIALRYVLVLVPLAIVASEVRRARERRRAADGDAEGVCDRCSDLHHAPDAAYCLRCGRRLTVPSRTQL